jgi:hypothetical protein
MRDVSLASAGDAGDSGADAVAGDAGPGDDGGDDGDGVAAGCEPPQAAMARTLTTWRAAKRIRRR